jgi:hypothetical protein
MATYNTDIMGDPGTAPPWLRQTKPLQVTTQPTPAPSVPGYDQPNRTGDGMPPGSGPIDLVTGQPKYPNLNAQPVATPNQVAPPPSPVSTPAPTYQPAMGTNGAVYGGTGVTAGAMPAWNAGMIAPAAAPGAGGASPLSVDLTGLPGISTDYSGDAQRGADAAYKGATQFFDQDFTRDNAALETKLINQGFAPGSEAFKNEMEMQKRGQNAARENAGFQAQGVGFDQAGQLLSRALASRAALYGERSDNANRAVAARGQDRSVDAAGLGASASMANAGAAADASKYSTDANATVALRRLGLDSSNADVTNLIALINSARGGVNMPNFGSPSPLDVTGANSIASGNANAASNRAGVDRATLAQLGGTVLGEYFKR